MPIINGRGRVGIRRSGPSIPELTTTEIGSITATTAIGGGNITSDGGALVTERGICWATTENPTISNNKIANGAGSGSFTSNITGLTRTTTYYVRAYATNSMGTAYGNQVSLTTTAALATVTTSISSITTASAIGDGNVTDNGGLTITAQGICWGTASNPTTSNFNGSGIGSPFTVNMASLASYTVYYARAYATNSLGTSYGNEVMFVTSDPEFIMVWNTTKSGAANKTITIPTYVGYGILAAGVTYSYTVDWGDGTVNTNQTGNATRTYATAGTYSIKISGIFPGIYSNNQAQYVNLIEVKNWGSSIKWRSMENAFSGCSNMNVTAKDAPDLSLATSMFSAFGSCTSLRGTASLPLFNTSNITNMGNVFQGASVFNIPIGNWNTSKVTSMRLMFANATAFNQDISTWDVSKVTDMQAMFSNAPAFNRNLGNWNVSSVLNMMSMFSGATNFNNGGATGIGNWNVSNVTTMNQLFYNATNFNQNLSTWNTSKVTAMAAMFYGCTNFNNGGATGIGNWNTSLVTDMSSMFYRSGYFNQPIGGWNTSNVTNMANMFEGRTAAPWTIFNQNIGTWDVSKVTNMAGMFLNHGNFNNGGATSMGNWNTGAVTNMSNMFNNSQAFNQPIGNWNTSNVTNMANMFTSQYGGVFNQNIGAWNVSKVTNMSSMFRYSTVFNNGGSNSINNWNTLSLANMSYMFANTSFNQPIGNWYTATASNAGFMFFNNTAFNQDIGAWNTAKITSFESMFQNASAFNNGGTSSINNWTTSSATTLKNMFNGATAFNQPIGNWNVSNVSDFSTFMASKTPTTLSAANLDSIYNGWSTRTLVSGRFISFGTAKYTSASSAGRAILTTAPKSWVITDGGMV